jgi:glyoxylase-like metal-dependent hydrolase (beta-lactamase superfamily II)
MGKRDGLRNTVFHGTQSYRIMPVMHPTTITPFNIGLLSADLSNWFGLPDGHPYAGRVEKIPMQCYLIGLPGRYVLVDAPAYEFPDDDSMLLPNFRGRSAAGLLAASGIPATAITDVVITHPHLDHTLGIVSPVENPSQAVFPNARHYLGAKDWENLPNMEETERRPLEVVQCAGLLTLVDGPLDLGDGLTLLPTPGETPGHQILRLKNEEGEAYFVGDLFHHLLELGEDRHPVWAEAPAMRASKSMLTQLAAAGNAWVFFAHITGSCRVEQHGSTFRWIQISG